MFLKSWSNFVRLGSHYFISETWDRETTHYYYGNSPCSLSNIALQFKTMYLGPITLSPLDNYHCSIFSLRSAVIINVSNELEKTRAAPRVQRGVKDVAHMRAEQGQRTEEYCEDDGGALGQVGRPIDLSRIGRSTVSAVEPR